MYSHEDAQNAQDRTQEFRVFHVFRGCLRFGFVLASLPFPVPKRKTFE